MRCTAPRFPDVGSRPQERRVDGEPAEGRTNSSAQAPATAAEAAPMAAAIRNPTIKATADSWRANTNPSDAVAINPEIRATALLMPEAIPTRSAGTDSMTPVVRGATHAP